MKISVCGKGGSGKSTIVALLAAEARSRGYRVLVVDSDESNSGLFRILGFAEPPVPLMELVGGKKKIISTMNKGFSEGDSEAGAMVMTQECIMVDDIPAEYIAGQDTLRLVAIGKILQSLEGCACPMGVLSREFLNRLNLKENEMAIVDTEAGVEHFGRGLETGIDRVLIVVEPSFESILLAEKINGLSAGIGVSGVVAVLNKVTSEKIAVKLTEELKKRGIKVTGVIHQDPEIFNSSLEGSPLARGKSAEEIKGVLDSLQ